MQYIEDDVCRTDCWIDTSNLACLSDASETKNNEFIYNIVREMLSLDTQPLLGAVGIEPEIAFFPTDFRATVLQSKYVQRWSTAWDIDIQGYTRTKLGDFYVIQRSK